MAPTVGLFRYAPPSRSSAFSRPRYFRLAFAWRRTNFSLVLISPPVAIKKTTPRGGFFIGSDCRIRTNDQSVNSRLLYR